MSSAVVIALDTTPPVVTFGDYTNAEAGFTLQIAYTCADADSASSVTNATISNQWGQSLPMQIAPDGLSVDLPNGWYDGAATISATGTDEVGNAAAYATQVPVSGAPDPTPTPTPGYIGQGFGGAPLRHPDAHPERRHRRQRSRSRVTARSTITRHRSGTTSHVARSDYSVAAVHRPRLAVVARTHHELTGRLASVVRASGRTTVSIQRRDDPGTELALLELGLL